MKALITVGCMTDHGATISTGDSSFLVEGKAVHLDGMTHFCPTCKVQSKAIASNQGFMMVGGRSIVAAGDKSTCGSKYLKISDLAVMSSGGGNGASSISSLANSFIESKVKQKFNLKFQVKNNLGQSVKNAKYMLIDEDGEVVFGTTSSDGYTSDLYSDVEKKFSVHVLLDDTEGFEND